MFFSLPQPFRGEYLGLKENPKYRKLQTTANDKLVMADYVKKVNRGDGKVGPLINLLWLARNCSKNMPSSSHIAPVKGRVLLIVILERANILKHVCNNILEISHSMIKIIILRMGFLVAKTIFPPPPLFLNLWLLSLGAKIKYSH